MLCLGEIPLKLSRPKRYTMINVDFHPLTEHLSVRTGAVYRAGATYSYCLPSRLSFTDIHCCWIEDQPTHIVPYVRERQILL